MPKTFTHAPDRRWTPLTLGAEHVGVSEKTLRRWIAGGILTGYRVGPRMIRVDLDELEAIMRPIPSAGNVA
jgi:excisionase family DNA binding protein